MMFETSIILSDIAVVPDLDRNKRANSHWLVVNNRSSWLESFEKSNRKLRKETKQHLIRECTLLTGEDITIDSNNPNTSSGTSGCIQDSSSDGGKGSSQDSSGDNTSLDSSGDNTSQEGSSDDTSQESSDDDSQESSDDNSQDSTDNSNGISSYCSDNSSRVSSDGSSSNSR